MNKVHTWTTPKAEAPNWFLSKTPHKSSLSLTITTPSFIRSPWVVPHNLAGIFAVLSKVMGCFPIVMWFNVAVIYTKSQFAGYRELLFHTTCLPVHSLWGFKIAGGGILMDLLAFTLNKELYKISWNWARVKNVSLFVRRAPDNILVAIMIAVTAYQ